MPYNSTGTYTPPAGATTAAPGDIIRSATWNAIFSDISTALTGVGNQIYGDTIVTTTPYAPLATDTYLAMDVTSASVVNLPSTAARGNYPITIKDITGKAQQYPITINPNGSEKIEQQASIMIFVPYGGVTLRPISGGWTIVSDSHECLTTVMSGTATASSPSVILRATDNIAVTASSTDRFGNFTPEGWGNICTQQLDWYGAGSLTTGARGALLANVFLSTPSAAGNAADFYSPIITTCNIYTDDNGTLGSPAGSAFGLATVTYISGAVKHWSNVLGAEFDVVCAAGSFVQNKVGVLVDQFAGDVVQGASLDAAFIFEGNATCPGWRSGFVAGNSGASALSADGTLLGTLGANTFTNVIDVTSSTITGYLYKSTPLKITGQGAYNLTLTAPIAGDLAAMTLQSYSLSQHIFTTLGRFGSQEYYTGVCGAANDFFGVDTIAGDAIIGYVQTLYLGHIGVAPHMVLSGNGLGYAAGTGGTIAQATNKSTGVTLNKTSGQVTMNNAALAGGAIISFVLTDSAIAATDVLILNHISGGTPGAYSLNAQAAAGSATINVRNNTAGSLSEAIVIQFAIIKAVNA